MTPLERLKLLRDSFVQWSQFGLEHFDIVEQALNEHEALKKDVARYFDLLENYEDYTNEFIKLGNKLSKVGKKE